MTTISGLKGQADRLADQRAVLGSEIIRRDAARQAAMDAADEAYRRAWVAETRAGDAWQAARAALDIAPADRALQAAATRASVAYDRAQDATRAAARRVDEVTRRTLTESGQDTARLADLDQRVRAALDAYQAARAASR